MYSYGLVFVYVGFSLMYNDVNDLNSNDVASFKTWPPLLHRVILNRDVYSQAAFTIKHSGHGRLVANFSYA